jgi:FkbM family methyltransferase
MYIEHIGRPTYANKLLVTGIKIYERIKLALQPSEYKEPNSKEYLPYLLDAVIKGYTVLDIGSHKRGYFFDLFKISKLPGRLVAFETSSGMYSYLQKMKQLMKLENIIIEPLSIPKTESRFDKQYAATKNDDVTGATVIDFTDPMSTPYPAASPNTIDHYCSVNGIIPALIKFKLEGNDLTMLKGSRQLLQKYKPQIVLECAEGIVSRDTMMATFSFFSELSYSGYFILDTIKVPLASFDFNIYQNEILGFYCNNFVFE